MIKRNNGYLDLNHYFKNKDTEKYVKKSSYAKDHYWINLNGQDYYFKKASFPVKELVASLMAKKAGFDSVTYDLAYFGNTYGLISKSYHKEGCKYISMADILGKYYEDNPDINYEMGLDERWAGKVYTPSLKFMTNLMTFWQALEYYFDSKYQKDIKRIMYELVKRYFFYIIINNYDNLSRNFEIEVSDNHIQLSSMYDNEFSFAPLAEVGLSTDYSDSNAKFYESLVYFFSVSSSEYIEIFSELYNKLDLNLLEETIKQIEKQIKATIPEEQKETLTTRLSDARKVIRLALRENGINIKKR